jgi:hypothetical protein
VTCLGVVGNVATVNIRVPERGGLSHITTVTATDSPGGDQIRVTGGRLPGDCSPLPTSPGRPVVEGDIVVVDAQPLPASKEQCKNGGWRNFPGFKNQGDCVSFVATKGKNPPAGTG